MVLGRVFYIHFCSYYAWNPSADDWFHMGQFIVTLHLLEHSNHLACETTIEDDTLTSDTGRIKLFFLYNNNQTGNIV